MRKSTDYILDKGGRMNFKQFFSKQISKRLEKWKEFGSYQSSFYSFGSDLYQSSTVRSCIRPLAEHTSKANPVCKRNKQLERLLQLSPNMYMNGKDFLYKCRTIYELKNTLFVSIMRDEFGRIAGVYPIPYQYYDALEDSGGNLYIKFTTKTGFQVTFSWDDLIVLRKDYNESDIAGDDNQAITPILELINTSNQGIANAVKSTANLRGIIKVTKGILASADVKAKQKEFTDNYMNISNEGGIAAMDSTMEFTPVNLNPSMTSWAQTKEMREDVYRYFGVNEKIVTSCYSEEEFNAFYEAKIEPFLIALSLEFTRKLFTARELGVGNSITFESNKMAYASNTTKLAMVALVDRGALTPNELREIFNLSPVKDGDVPLRRLDTVTVDDVKDEPIKEEENE